jgi:hypothetical protein
MNNRAFSANNSFLLFTVAVMLLLVLPNLLQHGMFMDGTQYAIIAKNYAEGKGSFWFPFLSSSSEKHGQNAFLEHPPLIYFLQSFFFTIGGQSFLCERMYCLLTMILSAILIALIWKLIHKNDERYKDLFWFPILLWIVIPSVTWSFKNNMHENTLSVFVLASVYFLIRSVQESGRKYIFIVCAGLSIFLASLSKGLPGLFPLSFYFIYAFCTKNITWKRAFGYTVAAVIVPVLIYFLIICFNDAARASLHFHVKERLLYRIVNNPQVENRFVVLFWLLCDLIVPIILLLIIKNVLRFKNRQKTVPIEDPELKKRRFLFLALGLAGVLPLCLTLVQRAVYFVPALPFLAIAFALIFLKEIENVVSLISQRKRAFRIFTTLSVTLVLATGIYSSLVFGGTWRDETELNDAHKIAAVTGENAFISAKAEIYQEWGFQYYLLRYHQITIDPRSQKQPFMLIDKSETPLDTNYRDTQIVLNRYKLFKRVR